MLFNQKHLQRRGITSTLAMLFLVIFTTMALAFYANLGVNMAATYNDASGVQARIAAESGMEFVRLQLSSISIPRSTAPSAVFDEVYSDLATAINGSANLSGGSISKSGDVISMPANPNSWISVDSDGSQFRATVTKVGEKLRVQVTGRKGTVQSSRTIQLDYGLAQKASAIFDYGVASKSAITLNGNVSIRGTKGNEANGSVLSTTMSNPTPVAMVGNCDISGDVSVTNPNASSVSVDSGCTIAGYSPSQAEFSNHVHADVAPPEFPTVDTSVFAPYATNVISSSNPSGTSFTNIRIRAGTNPTFNNNTTIRGVVYIEYPNRVTFNGQANIQGVVVVQTNEHANEDLDQTANLIRFRGGVSAQPLSTLPDTAQFPASLRSLSGAFVLAPGFTTSFGGNFGTVSGSIIASQLSFSGTAGGTVKGSVINLKDTALSLGGTSDIIIQSQGTTDYPAGVFFGSNYTPLRDTYLELAQ